MERIHSAISVTILSKNETLKAYFMVDGRLTVLQSHTKSLWTPRLLGLLHDVDAPQRLVVI